MLGGTGRAIELFALLLPTLHVYSLSGLGAPVAFPQFEISFSEVILTVVGFTRTFGCAFRFSQFWPFAAMGRGIKK